MSYYLIMLDFEEAKKLLSNLFKFYIKFYKQTTHNADVYYLLILDTYTKNTTYYKPIIYFLLSLKFTISYYKPIDLFFIVGIILHRGGVEAPLHQTP